MSADLAAKIRAEVAARRPLDDREAASIVAFLERIDVLDEPFSEHADDVHVTASAVVINERGTRVVLHKHKRLGLWLQPGGHIEPGESPWDGALREAIEETGLPCRLASTDLLHVDVHPGPRGHTHLDLRYLVFADDVEPTPGEGESQDVRWYDWPSALDIADAALAGLLRALAASAG